MKTKSCQYCNKMYVGNGYEDACTRECHYKAQYARIHKKTLRNPKLYEKPAPHEDPIKKANDTWVEDAPKKVQSPKEKRRINALLNSTHVREKPWRGRQYDSVRG